MWFAGSDLDRCETKIFGNKSLAPFNRVRERAVYLSLLGLEIFKRKPQLENRSEGVGARNKEVSSWERTQIFFANWRAESRTELPRLIEVVSPLYLVSDAWVINRKGEA